MRGDASLFLSFHQGDTIDLVVLRDGEKVELNNFPMIRREYSSGADSNEKYMGFGIYTGDHIEPANFISHLRFSWLNALDFVQLVRFSLVQLFTGGASVKELSGPVGIVTTITQVGEQSKSASDAAMNVLYFAALIAINLSVMNLLPFPALDGGRILFLILDAFALLLFKRPVPEKYQAAVNAAGMAVLLLFMLFVTVQDVLKLFQ